MERNLSLSGEHGQLEQALEEIGGTFRAGVPPARLRESLGTFATLLQAHFAHEEASYLFQELPLEFPRFAQDIDRLRKEHVDMLAELRLIADQISLTPLEAAERFDAFSRIFEAHEHLETEILQRVHCEDIAPGD